MAANDTASMALFCDFENIALGVRDAQYEKFDIRPVLERLLAKGSIVVKKAYCDWERYRGFKAAMHEANFELIEIPHVRQSGKNSADIRMVVDALDLCYTKSHVDTFVIISGDSDFSPLVSKLRENAKRVIGVGVKQSCSDLLVTNCDEFIYYDDLVRDREASRGSERREREKRSPEEEAKRREKMEERKSKAVALVSATFADLMADRGEAERIWASVLKEVVKRRNPGFNETYYGFRTFGNLLEEAAARGLLAVGRDEKSGTFVIRAQARALDAEPLAADTGDSTPAIEPSADLSGVEADEKPASRRRGGRRNRRDNPVTTDAGQPTPADSDSVAPAELLGQTGAFANGADREAAAEPANATPASDDAAPADKKRRTPRRPRKSAEAAADGQPADMPLAASEPAAAPVAAVGKAAPRKTAKGEKAQKGGKAPKGGKAVVAAASAPAETLAPEAQPEASQSTGAGKPARSRKPRKRSEAA